MSTPIVEPVAATAVDYDPFAGDAIARVVPTTEAQRELWLADQLGREASLAYNESISLALRGPLDAAALRAALDALVERHEAMRATLSSDGLHMLVAPHGSLAMERLDLAAMDDAGREAALAALRLRAVETPFDLAQGPLFRATLAVLGPESHELVMTAHHVVCDGWSWGVIATELMALYGGAVAGDMRQARHAPATAFGDYALSWNEAARLQAAEDDARWWVRQYSDGVPVLELPLDRPRRGARTFDSRREDLVIEAPLAEAVRKMGARHGASLFATMFAVFAATVSRLAGQSDVVVGVPAAGQATEGAASLVGHCVQLLPVRVAMDLEQPFTEVLAAARTRVLDAYEHPSCTYGTLLKKLQVARDPSRLPLVSVLFNLDSAIDGASLSKGGLAVELRSNPRSYENFDLFLNASQADGRIVLECQYNTSLLDGSTVARW